MAEDLVKQLQEQAGSDHMRGCQGRQYSCDCGYDLRAEGLLEQAVASLAAKDKEIARLRAVVSDCAKAIGNGAGVAPSSSIEFIELLPGEIAMHTDKLRRFLKCARDEGAEALGRAEQAERASDLLRAELDTANANHRQMAKQMADLGRALAEAVGVLRPFASEADGPRLCGAELGNDWKPFLHRSYNDVDITNGHLRAARAFVAQHGSDSTEGK